MSKENTDGMQSIFKEIDQAYGLEQGNAKESTPNTPYPNTPYFQEEAVPAERAVLSNLFGIVLAVKTIYPQAKTDEQRIELLTGVLQALLEVFDEGGVEMDQESFAATAMGLSNIASEEWA